MDRHEILDLADEYEAYEWSSIERNEDGSVTIRNSEKGVSIHFEFDANGTLLKFTTQDHEKGILFEQPGSEFVDMPCASEALEWAWESGDDHSGDYPRNV